MFYGTYRHAVDAKGRVALPAQFRRDLSGGVVAPGADARLVIRPMEDWQEYVRRFMLTADSSYEERRYMRLLNSDAKALGIDAQGRILLTPEHRAFAAIGDRAVFVGVSNAVEVVGEELWDSELADFNPQSFTELGDRLSRTAPLA